VETGIEVAKGVTSVAAAFRNDASILAKPLEDDGFDEPRVLRDAILPELEFLEELAGGVGRFHGHDSILSRDCPIGRKICRREG
jgi:hypothetical protein